MADSGPQDPIGIRYQNRFLAIVAALLFLIAAAIVVLGINNGLLLTEPVLWGTAAVLSTLAVLAIRARIRPR